MIKIKKVRLMANYILTTSDEYSIEDYNNGIIEHKDHELKEYQKVIAVGPMVRNIKEGDLVNINPKRYAKMRYKPGEIKGDIEQMQQVIGYNFHFMDVDDQRCLVLVDQDINFVVEEWEEIKPKSKIIMPKQEIIKPV